MSEWNYDGQKKRKRTASEEFIHEARCNSEESRKLRSTQIHGGIGEGYE